MQEYLGDKIEWCFCNGTSEITDPPCNGATRQKIAEQRPESKETNDADEIVTSQEYNSVTSPPEDTRYDHRIVQIAKDTSEGRYSGEQHRCVCHMEGTRSSCHRP